LNAKCQELLSSIQPVERGRMRGADRKEDLDSLLKGNPDADGGRPLREDYHGGGGRVQGDLTRIRTLDEGGCGKTNYESFQATPAKRTATTILKK
jgi:hypothetical protein